MERGEGGLLDEEKNEFDTDPGRDLKEASRPVLADAQSSTMPPVTHPRAPSTPDADSKSGWKLLRGLIEIRDRLRWGGAFSRTRGRVSTLAPLRQCGAAVL